MRSHLIALFSPVLFLFTFTAASGQNPSQNMTLLGRWDVDTLPVHSGIKYNDVWGYADCAGREYAILGSAGRIHFIDVTKPGEPREIASFPGSANSIWRDFKTYRDRAYACADQGQDGLMVFDLSRLPDTVVMTYQSNEIFRRSHNLWVDTLQGRLYMAGANTANNGVIIYDLNENPDQPQLLASIPLPGGYIHDIHVVDNIGYCSHGFNGMWVYDFTDPQHPVTLGSLTDYPERGYNHSGWLSPDRNYFIMADETHGASLKVVDVRDNSDISVVSLFKSALLAPLQTGSIVHNPFVRDQYVVLAYYHDGIQIYDMSDPANVTRVAYYDTYPINTNYNGFQGAWGTYPYLPSGNILGSDITFGLHVLRADSIEFLPGPRHRFPETAIEADYPEFCEGGSVQLATAAGAESYAWFLNGEPIHAEGPTLNTNTGGLYQVEARNGHCVAISDAFIVQEVQPPLLEYGLETTVFCAGDSARLDVAGDADSVFLFRADGFRVQVDISYELKESGIYGLEGLRGPCTVRIEDAFEITAIPTAKPEVELNGNVLLCRNASLFTHFQWYLNGMPIAGANAATWTALGSGAYTLETIDSNTCYALSDPVHISVSATDEPFAGRYTLFPNPAKAGSALFLSAIGNAGVTSPEETAVIFRLRDALGREVLRCVLRGTAAQEIPITHLAPGLYFYEISNRAGQRPEAGKLVIAR